MLQRDTRKRIIIGDLVCVKTTGAIQGFSLESRRSSLRMQGSSSTVLSSYSLVSRHREFLTGVRIGVNAKLLAFTPLWAAACLSQTKLLSLHGARVALEVPCLFEGRAAISLLLHERTCDTESDRFSLC